MTAPSITRNAFGLAERTFAGVWRSLPVWCCLSLAILHVLSALTFLRPARVSAVATVLFPLLWVALYCLVGRTRADRDEALLASIAAPIAALLSWTLLFFVWNPSDSSTLQLGFQLVVFVWAALLCAHCYRERGSYGVMAFFVAGALYGFLLEASGIELGYFSEAGMQFFVPWTRTGVGSIAGWCTIFYPAFYIAESIVDRMPRLRHRAIATALGVALVALFADLHFDPIATAFGMWTWNGRLSAAFLGVPLVNFTSWFTAVFAFAAVYLYVERTGWSRRRKSVAVVLSVPLMQLFAGIANFTLIGLLEGFSGPSWGIALDAVRLLH